MHKPFYLFKIYSFKHTLGFHLRSKFYWVTTGSLWIPQISPYRYL